MDDLIRREDAIKAINLRVRIPHDVVSAQYASMAKNAIYSVPSADRPQDDCSTCEHYNDVGDWCKTCGVSHYTPRMKGADDE